MCTNRGPGNRLNPASVETDVLDDLLRRHDGVITLAQARRVGISQDSIERQVRSGHWRRCSRGVYFVVDRPYSDAARVRAAVWSLGERATATGVTAAWWLGLAKFAPDVVEVTVPRVSNHVRRPGVRIRRRDLAAADVGEWKGLRTTVLTLTVVEAAVRQGGGPQLMDSALQRQTTLPGLWNAHLRNKGRHGAPRARLLLQAASDGTRSTAERRLAHLLTDAGLTGWRANHPVAGYVVDFAFVGQRVAIEVDGFAFHSDAADFQRDRNRQNVISLEGWQILRFTWIDVTEFPDRVVAEIRRAIRAR